MPLVLQTMGAVGLTGYLSFRSGQKAVNQLTEQLMGEVSHRVEQTLTTYLAIPYLVNRLNRDAIDRGDLNLNLSWYDPHREKYLWQQMRQFSNLSWISLGAELDGAYLGAPIRGIAPDSSIYLEAFRQLQSLHIMPPEWVSHLNLAARSADEKSIAQLLEAIPEEHQGLKEAIAQLVSEFQLEHLITLTQST